MSAHRSVLSADSINPGDVAGTILAQRDAVLAPLQEQSDQKTAARQNAIVQQYGQNPRSLMGSQISQDSAENTSAVASGISAKALSRGGFKANAVGVGANQIANGIGAKINEGFVDFFNYFNGLNSPSGIGQTSPDSSDPSNQALALAAANGMPSFFATQYGLAVQFLHFSPSSTYDPTQDLNFSNGYSNMLVDPGVTAANISLNGINIIADGLTATQSVTIGEGATVNMSVQNLKTPILTIAGGQGIDTRGTVVAPTKDISLSSTQFEGMTQSSNLTQTNYGQSLIIDGAIYNSDFKGSYAGNMYIRDGAQMKGVNFAPGRQADGTLKRMPLPNVTATNFNFVNTIAIDMYWGDLAAPPNGQSAFNSKYLTATNGNITTVSGLSAQLTQIQNLVAQNQDGTVKLVDPQKGPGAFQVMSYVKGIADDPAYQADLKSRYAAAKDTVDANAVDALVTQYNALRAKMATSDLAALDNWADKPGTGTLAPNVATASKVAGLSKAPAQGIKANFPTPSPMADMAFRV